MEWPLAKGEEEDKATVHQPVDDVNKDVEEDVIEPGSTVFVKNLSFDTTDEGLDKLFRKKYRIKSVQISKKLNPADPSKSLSMGFGFVQFYTQEEAQRAIKEMQEGTVSDRTAREWLAPFRKGDFNLEDSFSSGRESDVDNDRLRQLVESDHNGLLVNLRRTWVCTTPPSPGTYINWLRRSIATDAGRRSAQLSDAVASVAMPYRSKV
ncbi:unnamed protein product [Heligmosomoides polygyrus]|uniref:RRM domain-containing protein n=1 Tax=Heligmosomoides polygyrus TaxID=6339 RepID=A0A3P8B087_HELPZ|nr:unnamed protein product [Heligmosomoides polygyrus]